MARTISQIFAPLNTESQLRLIDLHLDQDTFLRFPSVCCELPTRSCARHPACSDDATYHSVSALSVCVRDVARVCVVSTICGGSAGCEGCASHSSSPSSDTASVVLSVRYCAPPLYLLGLLFHTFFVSTNLILCCLFKNL